MRVPEEATSGSAQNAYLPAARQSAFVVVLLTKETRQAVRDEIEAALEAGNHVAAFALKYRPHQGPGDQWVPTPEEAIIRSKGLFIRDVKGISELVNEVWKAAAYFISKSVATFRLEDDSLVYSKFGEWLNDISQRVYLAQRTSMVVLGARKARGDEAECLRRLDRAMENRRSPRLDCVHFYDEEETAREFRDRAADYDIPAAQDRLRNYCKLIGSRTQRRPRMRLVPIRPGELSPALLVDNSAALFANLGSGGVFLSIINEAHNEADRIGIALSRNLPTVYDQSVILDSLKKIYGDPAFSL